MISQFAEIVLNQTSYALIIIHPIHDCKKKRKKPDTAKAVPGREGGD